MQNSQLSLAGFDAQSTSESSGHPPVASVQRMSAKQADKFRAMAEKLSTEVENLLRDRTINTSKKYGEWEQAIDAGHRRAALRDILLGLIDSPYCLCFRSKAGIEKIAYLVLRRDLSWLETRNAFNPDPVRQWADFDQYYVSYDGEFRELGLPTKEAAQEAVETLRAMVQPISEERIKHERIQALLWDVARNKPEGWVPTPDEICQELMRVAFQHFGTLEGKRVLEPSAGHGPIADVFRAAGCQVDCCERLWSLRQILEFKGYPVIGDDTMELRGDYDIIAMNPPFENGQDMKHVQHVYENCLRPGGVLVALMSPGFTFRKDKTATQFREWIDCLQPTITETRQEPWKLSPYRTFTGKVNFVRIRK